LYKAVLEECKILIENNGDEKTNDSLTKKVWQDLKKIINLYREIFLEYQLGIIRTFGIEYLDEMEMNFEQIKSENKRTSYIFSIYVYFLFQIYK
jgi:hypothetical protein